MTTKEIKFEIQKLLDKVPENVLQDLLNYLKTAQEHSKNQSEFSRNLKKILEEDKDLLVRLAK